MELFDNILSKFQSGFRKGHGTRHCLLLVLEIRKGATDNNKVFIALLTAIFRRILIESRSVDC